MGSISSEGIGQPKLGIYFYPVIGVKHWGKCIFVHIFGVARLWVSSYDCTN